MKNETFGSENTDDRIFIVQLDVQDEASIKTAIEVILNKWKTINILINTAAIFTLGYVEEVSSDDWSNIMNVNVRGYALMNKHIIPIFEKSGSIIHLASAAGLVSHASFFPYATSKGAIIQMTRNLALDLDPFNIRVNSISPGAIESPTLYRTAVETGVTKTQFDENHGGKHIKRLGHPQEIANMAVFLTADLSSFTTEANGVIDGGYTIV
ncbi:unnamed protein product [Rotaria socialis]|uniref:Uncharacterized protein n=1 Tax=Rotaria socialis TaxID=392032 RepID=A0A821HRF9_9BILA|nr:unnamed protein product [Rotaria socialis]CAF3463375.1 unnamed protein product [Rotaria socialis]CAF3777367.1 unnamed protein product [Rotaria socialis]CAF3798226.1 unnamed protein product [Rotaria socialis]CAF4140835.1 unnamed protein product [Rotaria socialis]